MGSLFLLAEKTNDNSGARGRFICCVSAKDFESIGSDIMVTKRMNGFRTTQPPGARRSCEILLEVGGLEHDLVDRIWEHQLAIECSSRVDSSRTLCHREYVSDYFGPCRALGECDHDFVLSSTSIFDTP